MSKRDVLKGPTAGADWNADHLKDTRSLLGDGVMAGTIHPAGRPLGKAGAPWTASEDPEEVLDEESVAMEVPDKALLPAVIIRPRTSLLVDKAAELAAAGLADLAHKARRGNMMDSDWRKYHKLVESVVRLSRESRENDKLDAPEAMTDEQLKEIAQEALGSGERSEPGG